MAFVQPETTKVPSPHCAVQRPIRVLTTLYASADYQLAESNNLQLDYSDETSDFRGTNFPARYIYERLLPEVVAANSNIHYHRSSPYSGFGKKTTDQTYGDLHQCASAMCSIILRRKNVKWSADMCGRWQGTCGTVHMSLGTIGISSPDALSPSSECTSANHS